MAVNEARQGLAGHQHQADGDDHRGHHHRQVVDHADGSDHRVERKDGVEHHDLRHHGPEFRPFALGGVIAVFPLQPLIKLDGRFKQQKQAAKQHNQIAGAKAEVVKNNQRFGQGDQPGDRGQQQETHDHRQHQASDPRAVALGGRELLGEDSDKDQVIDTQHQFDNHQRDETCPD